MLTDLLLLLLRVDRFAPLLLRVTVLLLLLQILSEALKVIDGCTGGEPIKQLWDHQPLESS